MEDEPSFEDKQEIIRKVLTTDSRYNYEPLKLVNDIVIKFIYGNFKKNEYPEPPKLWNLIVQYGAWSFVYVFEDAHDFLSQNKVHIYSICPSKDFKEYKNYYQVYYEDDIFHLRVPGSLVKGAF